MFSVSTNVFLSGETRTYYLSLQFKQLCKYLSVMHNEIKLPFYTCPISIILMNNVVTMYYRVKSQLKRLARPMYSNPPVHGARIVADVVGNPVLFNEWKAEMEMMAGRIKNVRQQLYNSITSKDNSGKDWSFILKQIGMFSFTGLNKEQVFDSRYYYFLPVINFCLLCTTSSPIASNLSKTILICNLILRYCYIVRVLK